MCRALLTHCNGVQIWHLFVHSWVWKLSALLFTSYIDLREDERNTFFNFDFFLFLYTGPNFMTLLTVSKELALMEAGNSAFTPSVFHGYGGIFGLCARHSTLKRLAKKCWHLVIVSTEFSGKQSHEMGPVLLTHST